MSRSGYDFYLGKCLLPVTPQKLQIKINNANKTITLIDEGQVNILKTAALTDIEFECVIPQVQYPFAVYKSGFQGASTFLDYFEELKTSKKPFQFIVTRTKPNGVPLHSTNIKVSMEEYTIKEDVKQGLDLSVKIKLKQFRDYGTSTVKIEQPQETASAQSIQAEATVTPPRSQETSPAPATAETYTVKSGDCLWNIAKKFYGDGSLYTKIYDANQSVLGGRSPNLIYAGDVLTIPAA